MSEKLDKPAQLISTLRTLAMRVPETREELTALERDCTSLLVKIQSCPNLGKEMPHIIWHFLADADIRFKDPSYAQTQLATLRKALTKWEHESAA